MNAPPRVKIECPVCGTPIVGLPDKPARCPACGELVRIPMPLAPIFEEQPRRVVAVAEPVRERGERPAYEEQPRDEQGRYASRERLFDRGERPSSVNRAV